MVRSQNATKGREGIILVVVVAMLALFAVVGLGYVLYAESSATASRYAREAQNVVTDRAGMDPNALLARALGDLIYDTYDDQRGVYNAIRGHGLARNMYGWNYQVDATGSIIPAGNNNTVAFNGLGRMRYDASREVDPSGAITTDPLSGQPYEGFDFINYAVTRPSTNPNDPNNFVRDAERFSIASGVYRVNLPPALNVLPDNVNQRYFGGANAPYTYPDNNNVYLAAVRAVDGKVLIPSFHRPYLFHRWDGSALDPKTVDVSFLANQNHPDWYRPSGRFKLLRPRPVDQLTEPQIQKAIGVYPIPERLDSGMITRLQQAINPLIAQGKIIGYPTDVGGDVKNLLGSPSGNDSVWVDLGMPATATASGKKYKPLFAFMVVDLDGRINLNAAGNVRGLDPNLTVDNYNQYSQLHASNQGIGRDEINIGRVLNVESAVNEPVQRSKLPEWTNVFFGWPTYPGPYKVAGRYDIPPPGLALTLPPIMAQPYPSSSGTFEADFGHPYPVDPLGSTFYLPSYYMVDLDGCDSTNYAVNHNRPWGRAFSPTEPLTLSSFPNYASSTEYVPGSGANADPVHGFGNDSLRERTAHPLTYNPLRPHGNTSLLIGTEMHKLIGRYNSPLDIDDTVLARLLPKNIAPKQTDFANATEYATALAYARRIRQSITMASADVGRPGLFPNKLDDATSGYQFDTASNTPLAQQGAQFGQLQTLLNPSGPIATGTNDFQGSAVFSFVGGSAPGQVVQTFNSTFDGRARLAAEFGRLNLNRPLRPYPNPTADTDGNYYDQSAADWDPQRLVDAKNDRQELANDIFDRLRAAVGAPDITSGDPSLKWLAQLAANIVDYIDEDDVMTQFQWNPAAPTDFVYGVEMPKVVINESYMEVTNGDASPGGAYLEAPIPPSTEPRAKKYQVNVWAELNNTMVPPLVNDGSMQYQNFVKRNTVWLANGPNGSKFSTYRLHLLKSNTTTLHTGDPTAGTTPEDILAIPGGGSSVTVDFASAASAQQQSIAPVDTAAGSGSSYRSNTPGVRNGGFYVIGPQWTTPPGETQAFKFNSGSDDTTFKHQCMTYDIPQTVPDPSTATRPAPTLVLQRLANPYMQHDPTTNPWVTVDMMVFPVSNMVGTQKVVNHAIKYNQTGNAANAINAGTVRKSIGRRQPFAGSNEQNDVKEMVVCPYSSGTYPEHTFFSHNASTGPNTPPSALPEAAPGGLERFDWFVHPDRKLTSPLELLHVSACAPWEVTQNFICKNPDTANTTDKVVRQGHTAQWTDDRSPYDSANAAAPYGKTTKAALRTGAPEASTRLYRALEYFRCADRTMEMAFGGRDIGKVNINTIWDKTVFDALFDAPKDPATAPMFTDYATYKASAGFTQKDVDDLWTALMTSTVDAATARTPNYANMNTYDQIDGTKDHPFWGMGAPHEANSTQYPNDPLTNQPNAGIRTTLLRKFVAPATATRKRPGVFDAESQFNTVGGNTLSPVQHPFLEKQMLAKAFEHLTTRSNVFAVYMTVGYFEVTDDSQKPELLGDEMGIIRDSNPSSATFGQPLENKAVRHRMFAIVDRTHLSLKPAVLTMARPLNDPNVIVAEDMLKSGSAPFYYNSAVEHVAPDTWRVMVPIPDTTVGNNLAFVSGAYNGTSWMLQTHAQNSRDGSAVYIGTGKYQRRMFVKNISTVGSPGQMFAQLDLGIPGGTGWTNLDTPPVNWGGPAGSVLITNGIPGNPGPQPDFDPTDPRYQGVVIYSTVLQ